MMLQVLWVVFFTTTCLCVESSFYVSVDGNSSNCTQQEPCGSIQTGVQTACYSAGNNTVTLWVGPGVYQLERISQFDCNIQIRSSNGSANTILEQRSEYSQISLSGTTVNNTASVEGFTFRNFATVLTCPCQITGYDQVIMRDIVLQNVTTLISNIVLLNSTLGLLEDIVIQDSYGAEMISTIYVDQISISGIQVNGGSYRTGIFSQYSSIISYDNMTLENVEISKILLSQSPHMDGLFSISNIFVSNVSCNAAVPANLVFSTGNYNISNLYMQHIDNFYAIISSQQGIQLENITGIMINSNAFAQGNIGAASQITLVDCVFDQGIFYSFRHTGEIGLSQVHIENSNAFSLLDMVGAADPSFRLENVTIYQSVFESLMILDVSKNQSVMSIDWSNCNLFNTSFSRSVIQMPYIQTDSIVSFSSVVLSNSSLASSIVNVKQVNFTMVDCSFANNSLPIPIPLVNVNNGTIILSNNLFNDNDVGSLLSFTKCSGTDTDSVYTDNSYQSGGIIFSDSVFSMNQTLVSSNSQSKQSSSFFVLEQTEFSIYNLTAEGNSGALSGVLLVSDGSRLTITQSTFEWNQGSYGGSIYISDDSYFEMDSSFISNCTATISGGGVIVAGTVQGHIKNCTFTDNAALSSGGSISLLGNTTILLDSVTITKSVALKAGGLFIDDFVTTNLTNIEISDCTAKTLGGAVMTSGYSMLLFQNCSFHDCIANSMGSGIFSNAFSSLGLFDVTIRDNYCPSEAGGIYLSDRSQTILHNVTFLRNRAQASAGGIVISINSTASIRNSIFDSNTSGSKGGAVAVFNQGNPTFTDTVFVNNSGTSGGAFYLADESQVVLTNCHITKNTANSLGGGIYASSTSIANVTNCEFRFNSAKSGPGGAFYVQDFSEVFIHDSLIEENAGTYGGGIYSISRNIVEGVNITLRRNVASYSGAGITLGDQAMATMQNSFCVENLSQQRDGGCLLMDGNAKITLSKFNISKNIATSGYGGGISILESASVDSSSCFLHENEAEQGGGIYVEGTAQFHTQFSSFVGNVATSNAGGIYVEGGNTTFLDTEFINNRAMNGGAMFVSYSNFFQIAQNCFFEANIAHTGGGIYLEQIASNSTNSETFNDYIETTPSIFSFQNITLQKNQGTFGGAIYLDDLVSSTPTFGPTVQITNNSASQFGAGIFYGSYNNLVGEIIMYNATFNDNYAQFGGSNVAFHTIANVSTSTVFCLDCDFGEVAEGGYQDPNGFASLPSHLGFNSSLDPCPGTVSLNQDAIDIAVLLYDQFQTIVTGHYLDADPSYVQLITGTSPVTISTYNRTQRIQSINGAAIFNHTSFTGPNNSTLLLQFSSITDLSISSTTCSILLYGCQGSDMKIESDSTADYCTQKTFSTKQLVFLLLGVIFSLCCVICILAGAYGYVQYKKKRKRDRYAAIEIPDFDGKPSVTLEDILKDPAIPRLDWNEISIGPTIGRGASGLVSRGVWNHNGEEVEIALKELLFGFQDFGPEVLDEFLIEIKLMSALQHKNIVKLIGICVPPDISKLYLVTELCQNGSVRDLLDKKAANLSGEMRLRFAKDAAKGVLHLHAKKLIHRDLKGHNLLVNHEWHCKIADFGVSTVRPDVTRTMTCVGTPVYMAPEVLTKNKYSEKADVYSFGHVLYELFTGNRPYDERQYSKMHQSQLVFNITENNARPSLSGLHPSLKQLIQDCWKKDAKLRPSFREIIDRLRRLQGEMLEPSNTSHASPNEHETHFLSTSLNSTSSDFVF